MSFDAHNLQQGGCFPCLRKNLITPDGNVQVRSTFDANVLNESERFQLRHQAVWHYSQIWASLTGAAQCDA